MVMPPIRRLLLSLGLLALVANAQATDCKLTCRAAGCAVTPATEEPLKPSQWQLSRQCEKLRVSEGEVELRYLHKSRWLMPPPLKPGQRAEELFAKFPPDQPCAVLSSTCLQTAMAAKQAAVGGHGIDARQARPAGEGQPCELGLPCGPVLPNEAEQPLRLTRADLSGQLQLRLARGAPAPGYRAEQSLSLDKGRATLAPGTLQPGSLYEYKLLDGAGRPLASGEFSVISTPMVQRLRQLAQQRMQQKGMDEALAWYDTLAENLLVWDALQIELGSTAP